ncbi:hypothetical protein ACT4R9_09910 [Ornithobacterium rhinotracheale]
MLSILYQNIPIFAISDTDLGTRFMNVSWHIQALNATFSTNV